MSVPRTDNESVRGEIRDAVRDMLFISETEAGLELLPADPEPKTQEAACRSLGEYIVASDGDSFLNGIRDSVDPGDVGLATYLRQWEDLFALLTRCSNDVRVYRSTNAPDITIDIVAIVNDEAVIIRTQAVET